MERRGIAIVGLCTLLISLVAAVPASASVTASHIDTPADMTRLFIDPAGPQSFLVHGTTIGSGPIDLRCYFGSNPSDYTDVGTNPVTAAAPTFSVSVPRSSLHQTDACVLRAVPDGDMGAHPPGSADSFTGPTIAPTEKSLTTAGLFTTDFLYATYGLKASIQVQSAGDCALTYSYVYRDNFAPGQRFFNCLATLFSAPGSEGGGLGRSEIRIDGVDAYDSAGPDPTTPGYKGITLSESLDATTGNLTIHDNEPILRCTGLSCFGSTGVELDRTWVTGNEGQTISQTDTWRSTDGAAHSIDLLYEQSTYTSANKSSFAFPVAGPGNPTFQSYNYNDMVSVPHGAGTIYIKKDQTTPDGGDGVMPQGAITYASAPDGPIRFTYSDNDHVVNHLDSHFVMPYQRTVPAGGSTTLRFAFAQGYSLPVLEQLAGSALAAFPGPTVTIDAPANGSKTTAGFVKVSGTVTDSGALSSFKVNGQNVAVGLNNTWSTTVGLTQGTNSITAVAVDRDNNVASKQISITYLPASGNPAVPLSVKLLAASQKGKGVQVQLACSGPSHSTCRGQGLLSTVETVSTGPVIGVSAAVKHKPKRYTVNVGSKGYSIPAGKTGSFTVLLNGDGTSLLAQFGKLPTTLEIRLAEPDGTSLVAANRKLTLKGKKKKRRA